MIPNQTAIDAACEAAIEDYRAAQVESLNSTGKYLQVAERPLALGVDGSLFGSATEYDGPAGKGVQANFRYIDTDGNEWRKAMNFGPVEEDYRNSDWQQFTRMTL